MSEGIWIEFNKDGSPVDPAVGERMSRAIREAGAQDLVVMSHGWKNNRAAALRIYEPLWAETSKHLKPGRKALVAWVLWPSVPFRDHIDGAALAASAAEGGGLAVGLPAAEEGDDAWFDQVIDDYAELTGDPTVSERAQAAASDTASDDAREFVRVEAERLEGTSGDAELESETLDLKAALSDDPRAVLQGLASPPAAGPKAATGGGLGVGEGVGKVFSGGKAAVARLLGQLTFFEIKQRAGTVGVGLGELLAGTDLGGARLHLVGHSFGARVVTAATDTLVASGHAVDTLTLLQGAFSHNAFARQVGDQKGAYHRVADGLGNDKVGLIAITHTHNDKACTLAYASASRVSRDIAKGFGGADDRFGAMGANGAQGVPVKVHDGKPGEVLPKSGEINNFKADVWIVGNPPGTDAHGDVFNEDVGVLLASVIEA